ncbi:MAG: isoaspartyl peptidase/L-asparaginase [Pseudomonadota bacterium]
MGETFEAGGYAIALHGGAGPRPGRDYAETEAHMLALATMCRDRLDAGESALDVVEHAVAGLEASGLYVAGRGGAPNRSGFVELDASIMDGPKRRGGGVAAVRDLVSPVAAARRVMEGTPHVLLAGEGAAKFARAEGLPFVGEPQAYYRTPVGVDPEEMTATDIAHGTVGAVALDREGRLAAATSTAGVFGKMEGRVGDTPLIGAGTWADADVAASCTGIGEAFILAGGAQDVASRVRYAKEDLSAACAGMLADVAALKGDGGVIAVDAGGRIALSWNSRGLKRAAAGAALEPFALTF